MPSTRPEVYRRQAELQSAQSNVYRFPSKPHPHTMMMVFKEYDYKSGFGSDGGNASYLNGLLSTARGIGGRSSGVSIRSERAVELPFPKQLSDSTGLNINGFSRDPLAEKLTNELTKGGVASGTLSDIPGAIQGMGAKIGEAMFNGDGNGVTNLMSSLGSLGADDAASVMKYALQKSSPMLGDAGNSINLALGQVLNPKETLAFEGVQLRSHQFNWDLFPSNVEDSNQINKIVNIMKRSVLPESEDFGPLGIEKAFLKYPHVCYIYLIGVDTKSFMKFKPALVTNMTVDYGSQGMSIMKGGKPSNVTLSVSLQELSIETAQDYALGDDTGNLDGAGDFVGP